MRESKLYIHFLKSNLVIFLLLGIIGMVVAYFQIVQLPVFYISQRMYEFSYTLENASVVEKQSDEAVAVMRSAQIREQLGMQASQVSIYKPSLFAVVLQIKDSNPENAVYQQSVLSGYFTQKYSVKEVGKEIFLTEKRPTEKYLFFGLAGGELVALIIALTLAYFRKY